MKNFGININKGLYFLGRAETSQGRVMAVGAADGAYAELAQCLLSC